MARLSPDLLPELETICDVCCGEGEHREDYWDTEPPSKCQTCDGVGRIIIDYGIKVMDFVSRWIDRKDKYQ